MNSLSFSPNRRPVAGLARCLLGLGMLLGPASVSRAQVEVQVAPPSGGTSSALLPVDLSGSWSGHWEDCKSGHGGLLRAEFCKCDDTHYRVHFSGRFFKVLPFQYTVVLNVVEQRGDTVILSGQNDLGLLFGTFTYQGEASATNFVATFSSCRYQGQFVMERSCCR